MSVCHWALIKDENWVWFLSFVVFADPETKENVRQDHQRNPIIIDENVRIYSNMDFLTAITVYGDERVRGVNCKY